MATDVSFFYSERMDQEDCKFENERAHRPWKTHELNLPHNINVIFDELLSTSVQGLAHRRYGGKCQATEKAHEARAL